MAFAVKTVINAERTSSKFHKRKTFEYDGSNGESKNDLDFGEPDVTFLVDRDVYHGHQHVFAKFSKELRECFGALQNGTDQHTPYQSDSSVGSPNAASKLKKVTIDAPALVFEVIFNFCYTRKMSVPVHLLPSVYLLAKRLCIESIQRPCAEYLADHITMGNVGQLCQLIQFSLLKHSFGQNASDGETLPPYELSLANSLFAYVQENADALACSLSGQLSVRLIVNLTGEFLPDSDRNGSGPLLGEDLVFGVLMWAQQRIVSGQRLARSGSEENVQSDDEESDGGTSTSGSVVLERNTKETRTQSLFPNRLDWLGMGASEISALKSGSTSENHRPSKYEPKDQKCKNVTKETLQCQHAATQDIRITLDMEELPNTIPPTFSAGPTDEENGADYSDFSQQPRSRHPSQLLTFCPSDGSETCVLAPTSLGIGSTSIWLGKLVGHLVSLSIKRCHSNSAASTPHRRRSSATAHRNNDNGSYGRTTPHSTSCESIDGSISSSDDQCDVREVPIKRVLEEEEVGQTVTAETAVHLARAAVKALSDSSSEDSLYGVPLNGRTIRSPDENDDDTPCIPSLPRLLEARSGAGAGSLLVDGKHHLIIAGGYTRKGCLSTVEVFTRNDSFVDEVATDHPLSPYCSLDAPLPGPRLLKPRGRLALAHSSCSTTGDAGLQDNSGVLYVCGGSNGSMDLNTVERLTSTALRDWLAKQAEQTTESDPKSSIRNSTTNGDISHALAWQPIARLNQARSSPSATGLDELTAGTLISNTRGSVLVAGGLAGAVPLPSVEAFIPERDQWVQLPDMCASRYEAACTTLASKNLVVVVGGDGIPSRRRTTNNDALVEALDPRCSNWIPVPSFNPGGQGKLRGAALVRRPATADGLLLIAGFNGQDTLNRTWLFDPTAWHWIPGPFLSTARTNPCAVTWSDRSASLVLGGFNGIASASGFLDTIEWISCT